MVMTRWIRRIIWVTGSCILSCPFCVCFAGGGSWWVCACTVGLLSITMISGYSTWSVISQVLNESSSYSQYFSRFLPFKEDIIPKEKEPESTLTPGDDASFIEKEISVTAQAFHSHLVLPWYSYISPDDKYSLQIRSTLEDLLTGIFKNLKQHTNVSVLFQHILTLYIQHFRQFYKALKKVSQKHKKRPIDCVNEKEDIREFYKPIHIALRTDDGIQLHFQRLAHLLLINYLPTEITRCNLLFLCLKDLFAQNILKITLDVICDTKWLNETLVSALDQTEGEESHEHTKDVTDKTDEERVEAKAIKEARVWCYTHSLSAIREETSFEVLDPDLPFYESGIPLDLKRFNGVLIGRNLSPQKNRKQGESLVLSEKKIENTHALLKYVQQSSILDRESNPRSKRTVATALGDLISTTTVPLLPDAITFPSKMWESPLEEEMKPVPSIKKNPFRKNIVEGLTETDYKAKMIKAPTGISAFLERQVLGSKKGTLNVVNSMIASELQRSGSLSNLPSKIEEGEELEKLHANHKLSSSSETLPRGWSSADDVTENEFKDNEDISKKNKAYLKKMNSFDKNDGLDEFSLAYFDGTHDSSEVGGCSSLASLSPTEKSSTPTMDFKEHVKCIAVSPTSMSSSSSTLGGDDLAQRPSHNSLELPLSPTSDALKEFGFENPDLSPIYEESENLASTIAKLRCLLSERQSQHSLGSQSSFGSSESEPKSAQSDPGRYNLERSRFTFYHKDSSGSLASVKSSSSTDSSCLHWTNEEEILEASEVPIDGKLFVSISIPSTEVHNESAGFQYTMYTIQYDAIYLCEIVPPSGVVESSNESTQFADHKMVLQTNIVKRRFREFLSLHSALEEDATLRGSMKGIKGPNKWLNLPFSKLDSATITSRKQFLEKYLQGLIQRAAINTSAPLKDFLAYTSDSSISFVKKPLEINVPRFDKLFARTVSGVFHSIKTALPTFDSAEAPIQGGVVPFSLNATVANGGKGNIHVIPEGSSIDKDRQESFKNDPLYDSDVQLDITAEEQVCELEGSLLAAITSTSELGSPVENATEAQDLNAELFFTNPVPFLPKNTCSLITFNPLYQEGNENPSNNVSHLSSQSNPLASFWAEIGLTSSRLSLRRQESQESLGTGESDHENSHPLFLALVDTLVEIIGSTDHPLTRQGATLLFTRIWAQPITNYIQSKLDHVLSEDLFQVFFNRVRYCIVNTGEQPKNESTSDQPNYETKTEESKEQLKHALKEFIPRALEFVLGSESTCESLTLFVESLQHPTLSKDLGLHLIDLIFVHLLLPV